MTEAQSKLPSFTGENRDKYDGPNTSDYKEYKVGDLDKGDIYVGEEFYLTESYENEYDVEDENGLPTGEKIIKHSAGLHIINHSNEWKIKASINLKIGKEDSIEAWEGSKLYDIIDSLIEFNEPGTGGNYNIYKLTPGEFADWREHINQLKNMTVEIIERAFGKNSTYNNVRFIKPEVDE